MSFLKFCLAVRGFSVLWLIISAVAGSAAVDLSGNWKLNIKESSFGVLPAPVSRTILITHKEPVLKLEISEDTGREKRSQTLDYSTDGKICLNKVRDNEFRSTLHWEESTLVIETKGDYQGRAFQAVDRWSMSPDGKTITVDRRASNDTGQTQQRLILERQ
jgi:hypothetical protein